MNELLLILILGVGIALCTLLLRMQSALAMRKRRAEKRIQMECESYKLSCKAEAKRTKAMDEWANDVERLHRWRVGHPFGYTNQAEYEELTRLVNDQIGSHVRCYNTHGWPIEEGDIERLQELIDRDW